LAQAAFKPRNHANYILYNSVQGRIILDIHNIVTESAQSLSSIKSGLHQNNQLASETSRLAAERNLTLIQAGTVEQTRTVTDLGETTTANGISDQAEPSPDLGETPTIDPMTAQAGSRMLDEQLRTSEIMHLSDSGLQPERNSLVCINATVHVKCPTGCHCQCHVARRTASSPSWLRPVLGSVLLVYQNLPVLGFRPCNEAQCQNAGSLRLNYRFPSWFWNRAVVLTAALADLSGIGATLHLRIPRVIYPDDNLWTLIIKNELPKIQMAFSQRLYAPLDVGQSGNSILHVSI